MITVTEQMLEKAIYDWAAGVLGSNVPVVWYHDNAPRPIVPYVALHIRLTVSVGVDAIVQTSPASGTINIVGNRDFFLYVQGIGKSSADFCEALKTSLEKPTVQLQLRSAGIAFVNRISETCVSELVDNRWEERNLLDLKFRYAQIDTDAPGSFDKIAAEYDLINIDLNTITVDNITIS